MKILLIDEYLKIGETIKRWLDNKFGYEVDLLTSTKTFKESQESIPKDYDVIIVNFGNFNDKELVSLITNSNPMQKLLILSADYHCTDELGCDHCRSNYQKMRFNTPFSMSKIEKYITDFDNTQCEYYEKCSDRIRMSF